MSNTDRDRVEDFFGRERDQIVSRDGSDPHWQSILRQARTRRRSRFLGYAAGVAAAALVIGGVSYGAVLLHGPSPIIAATHGVGTTATSAPRPMSTRPATPDSSASAPVGRGPVPATFAALSVSTVGGGNMFVLGSASCGGGRCPVLIGSTDQGKTWHLVTTFASSSLPSGSALGGGIQPANVLSQVRFASAKVGWVFGGDVQYTTDGGKSFRPYAHVGQVVIDVETDGSQVIVTSADGCANAVCSGARRVARASVTAAAAISEVGTAATGGELSDLQIVFEGNQPYVTPRWGSAPSSGFEPQRIAANGLVPLGQLGGTCRNASSQDVIATADPQGGLFAFCPGGAAAGSIVLGVFSSTDQGRSWTPDSAEALILVNSGTRAFAAANARELLAVSGGSPDTHGSMRISRDGGKSWRDPASPPPLPNKGWAWVGTPGGTTYYAVSGDAVPAFWKSDDSGETWTKVTLTS